MNGRHLPSPPLLPVTLCPLVWTGACSTGLVMSLVGGGRGWGGAFEVGNGGMGAKAASQLTQACQSFSMFIWSDGGAVSVAPSLLLLLCIRCSLMWGGGHVRLERVGLSHSNSILRKAGGRVCSNWLGHHMNACTPHTSSSSSSAVHILASLNMPRGEGDVEWGSPCLAQRWAPSQDLKTWPANANASNARPPFTSHAENLGLGPLAPKSFAC